MENAAPPAPPVFFYGTLMHPGILKRIIGSKGNHLRICGAILPGYSRRQVQGASYPAIIPWPAALKLFGDSEGIPHEEQCVRGILVYGVTHDDEELLDYFESRMFHRERITVHALGPPQSLNDWENSPESHVALPNSNVTMEEGLKMPSCEAETYVWRDNTNWLSSHYWSYDVFLKEKLRIWI
ncbi:hypothetical protein BOTBODRAFT_552120 [Botryobasidium botryosum FD-172 SS1]|uniref:Putative gamma-glutamylcyclotransferase n=1 Tax=Botryobasidium botryosum (strain FD-172 SS1) TaxID=930990 RepID=A0A067MRE0_BOTB1|nr:hypothetical protein BOTBODRAFT_552120 [Botryobasidium botryosum FD-172 SS1]